MRSRSLLDKYISIVSELDQSQNDDDLTTEEFLEWMVVAGYDMTARTAFTFDFDQIKNAEQASTIRNAVERRGYETNIEILEGELYFEVVVETKPLLEDI